MPRGQYDRTAAAQARQAKRLEDNPPVSAASPSPSRVDAERGDDWDNRSRKIKGHVDYFDMVKDDIPAGHSYEWKTYSIYGKVETQMHMIQRENGWSPVPPDRHPILPRVGDAIIHEGMILMERPKRLTDEARAEDSDAANAALRMGKQKAAQAEAGQLDRMTPRVNLERQLLPIDNDG